MAAASNGRRQLSALAGRKHRRLFATQVIALLGAVLTTIALGLLPTTSNRSPVRRRTALLTALGYSARVWRADAGVGPRPRATATPPRTTRVRQGRSRARTAGGAGTTA